MLAIDISFGVEYAIDLRIVCTPGKRIFWISQEYHLVGQFDPPCNVGDHTMQDAIGSVETGLAAIPFALVTFDAEIATSENVLGQRKKMPSVGIGGHDKPRRRQEGRVGLVVEKGKANLHWPVINTLCSNWTAAKKEAWVVRVLHKDRSIYVAKLINANVHLRLVEVRRFY